MKKVLIVGAGPVGLIIGCYLNKYGIDFDIIDKNEFGAILPEHNPLSKGHSVIIPLRHIASFFEVSEKERKSLSSLLELARNELKIRHQPEGFHIAFNDGDVRCIFLGFLYEHVARTRM